MKKFFLPIIFLLYTFFFYKSVQAADLYLLGPQSVSLNSIFEIKLVVDSKGESVNALETHIAFNPQFLKAISVEPGSSLPFLVNKKINNKEGTLEFMGGTPSPGLKSRTEVIKIIFLTKKAGKTNIDFVDKSKIINDSNNLDVFKSSKNYTVKIYDDVLKEPKENQSAKEENSNTFDSLLFIGMSNLITIFILILIILMIKKTIHR